jgi:hypothetical protein
MHPPDNFTRIVNRKRYSTKTATLLAGDDWWDGHNFERSGRQTFLYCTPKGAYFKVCLTQWAGQQDRLIPISQDEAIGLWETTLTEHRVDYEEAFPGVVVEDA